MRYRLLAKELRENCIWALIAFIVAMVVIFLRGAPDLLGPLGSHLLAGPWGYYAYYTTELRFGENVIALPLLWPTGVMTMFCMLWGGALGFAQTLVERGRGTYGVLLALPVTRMQVFAAKVATGVLLYLVSVGVPFGLLVLRAATPGHYPSPFRIWMLGPGVAAIACGVCAYAGATFTAMRPARWYVSRGAPLVAAVGICVLACNGAIFGAIAALMAAALLLWGAAVSMERRSF